LGGRRGLTSVEAVVAPAILISFEHSLRYLMRD